MHVNEEPTVRTLVEAPQSNAVPPLIRSSVMVNCAGPMSESPVLLMV